MEIINIHIKNRNAQLHYRPQYLSFNNDRVTGCDYSPDLLRWLIIGSTEEEYEKKVASFRKELELYNQSVRELWSIPGFADFFDQNNQCVLLQDIEQTFGADCLKLIKSFRCPHHCFPDLCWDKKYFFSRSTKLMAEFSIDGVSFSFDIQNLMTDVFKQDQYYCALSWTDDGRDYYYSLGFHFQKKGFLDDAFTDLLLYLEMEWQDGPLGSKSNEQKAICYLIKLLKSRGYLREYLLKTSDYPEIWSDYTEREDGVLFYMLDQKYLKDKLLCERIRCLLSNLYVYDEEGERDPAAPLYDAAIDGDNLDIPFYFLQDKKDKMYISRTPGQFGGHKKLKIYGKLDCPSAARYLKKGQYVQHRVFFADEETAIAAGYRPCAKCMREAYKKWKESQA